MSKSNPKSCMLTIEMVPLSQVRPYERNPRTHSTAQLKALARSIGDNGFTNPLLVDESDILLAGHGRLEAAALAGLERVPIIRLRHLNEAKKRAYRIADNRLAEKGSGWSVEMLQFEIAAITEIDADFDIGLTGFEASELDQMFDAAAQQTTTPEGAVSEVGQAAVTQLGDCWTIGGHHLVCGDATDDATYRWLCQKRPAAIFTDPPFNVPIDGHVSGLGKNRHREFAQASGEMSQAEFQAFLLSFMMRCQRWSLPGSLHYICMDWRHLGQLLAAGSVAYDAYINLCVWAKTNAGMGSLYRSQHELVAVFRKGARHRNNIELGKHGRHRSNLWTYAGMNSFAKGREEALAMHPTVKPAAMVRDAIMDSTGRGEAVLDPFAGSGTTLIAAAEIDRMAQLIELDPLYCDVIVRRAHAALGTEARLVETGESFGEVAQRRGARR